MELHEKINELLKIRRANKDAMPADSINGLAKELNVSVPTLRSLRENRGEVTPAYKEYVETRIDERL